MKVIQITDTHLSPTKPHFNGNWAPLLQWIEAEEPDLIIHTGDLSVDGADFENDLSFSMDLMRETSVPMLILPGNHDVGHLPGSPQPVNAERLNRWRDMVGRDYWFHDADTAEGNWRFIGLNALLFGQGDDSDGAEEEAQFVWLKDVLEGRGDRRVAMFSHKPLFVDEPQEGDTGYWGLRPAQRSRMYDLIAAHDVALFASGHLHWAWEGKFENTSLVWGPAAAFIIDTLEREMPGERIVGAVVHEFGDTVKSTIVAVPGMVAHVIDDVIEEVYPQSAKKAAPQETNEAAE